MVLALTESSSEWKDSWGLTVWGDTVVKAWWQVPSCLRIWKGRVAVVSMVVGVWGSWITSGRSGSRGLDSTWVQKWGQVITFNTWTSSDLHLPERLRLLKTLQSPKIVATAGDQVFNHLSISGSAHPWILADLAIRLSCHCKWGDQRAGITAVLLEKELRWQWDAHASLISLMRFRWVIRDGVCFAEVQVLNDG